MTAATVIAEKAVLFVMAVDAEYGPHLSAFSRRS